MYVLNIDSRHALSYLCSIQAGLVFLSKVCEEACYRHYNQFWVFKQQYITAGHVCLLYVIWKLLVHASPLSYMGRSWATCDAEINMEVQGLTFSHVVS
jgi:hypothetical protein